MRLHPSKLRAAVVFMTLSAASAGQVRAAEQPLFDSDSTLHVRLRAPFTTLKRERSDTEYLDGGLSYTDGSGAERSLDVKLRARGRYRRQRDTCDLPPIRLNFRKKQVEGTEFAGQDKLKLVTHCNENDRGEQYLLKEYLAYRIFNAVTDASFRARLLRITYVDTDKGDRTWTRYGFVIEDDDLLAERIGATVAEIPRIRYAELDPQQAMLVAVFQYLIGNTDWSLVAGAEDEPCCHNSVLFSGGSDRYVPIPYDFDFAGLVNPPYAEPNPRLPIRNVRQRLYRGLCLHNELMGATIAEFRRLEAPIRDAVMTVEGMGEKQREEALRYISGFYEDIADERSVERHLVKRCLG